MSIEVRFERDGSPEPVFEHIGADGSGCFVDYDPAGVRAYVVTEREDSLGGVHVFAIDDPDLIERAETEGIAPEHCSSSNLATYLLPGSSIEFTVYLAPEIPGRMVLQHIIEPGFVPTYMAS